MNASPEILDYDRLAELARLRREEFQTAEPYPHIVIDDFLPADVAEKALADFDGGASEWDHYYHYNERKLAITRLEHMAPAIQQIVRALQSPRFLRSLEELTGLEDLVADPHLDGAGMHKTLPGGYLNVHTDFLAHPKQRTWSRQINLLIYLNRDWTSAYNGDLELWDPEMRRVVRSVTPIFNRCVIFHTTDHSLHGHPRPLACPPGDSRKSIALYYFQDLPSELDLKPTAYHSRPEDSALKKLLITADTRLLRLYSWLRRHLGVRDGLVSRLLKYF